MHSTWPQAVFGFEAFLERAGLICQRREEAPVFGDKLLQYGDAGVSVRVVSDRGVWYVEVADRAGRPDEWYDAAVLRDLLLGSGPDILSLDDQIEFIETQWPAITERFNSEQRDGTYAQLASLRKDRAKRQFPDLYPSTGKT